MSIYLTLKVFHIIAVFLFLTTTSILFFSEKEHLVFKIIAGISGWIILLLGMGLALELGGELPFWIMAKFVIWFILTGFYMMVIKRFRHYRVPAYIFLITLASLAVFLAVFKPVF